MVHAPLFGVWHGYKHCCFKVFRAFHSWCMYLLHGTVVPGDNFPAGPPLRSNEMLFAAILCVDHGLRERLHRPVDERVATLERLRRTHAHNVVMEGKFTARGDQRPTR